MAFKKRPEKYGLYDPAFEHENCGVGFIAHIKGKKSHQILKDSEEILVRMTHRGAVGAEHNTGDGAGVLVAFPHEFLEKVAKRDAGIELPARGTYSAGIIFLPQDADERTKAKEKFENIVKEQGQKVLGWRTVPKDNSMIGPSAKACEPAMEQIFIGAADGLEEKLFERQLYIIKKRTTHAIRGGEFDKDHMFYVVSLSTGVMVYKGMLMPEQVVPYFDDLRDPDFVTHLAMVHSRFSTNTFPSWDRAQPLRFMSHNGEINTLRGNANKMKSREGKLESALLGEDLQNILPIIEPDLSDSGHFDNVLELLLMSGRPLAEIIMMMIPEAWQNHAHMAQDKKDFYTYASSLMEPWDGPASVVFTDGKAIGATLDRNGLRPSRFYVTKDDVVIMASEVGVLDVPEENVKLKGRLQPGKMFMVDFEEGRIIDDEEVKERVFGAQPYGEWLKDQRIELSELKTDVESHGFNRETLYERMRMHGYTIEHLDLILKGLVNLKKDPLGSMGNDAPLAVLSDKPRMIYDYFKQLFAQVTNPPIDSIREEVIMSLESFIGPESNLLSATPEHCHRLHMPTPFLTNEELAAIKHMDYRGWKAKTIDITYDKAAGKDGLVATLDRIAAEAEQAIADGYSLAILSDRAAGTDRVPVSALVATGAVHHHLVRQSKRTQIGLVIESGEPREVHHFCTLVGYGADAINPYLAFEAMWEMNIENEYEGSFSDEEIVQRYITGLEKGMKKVFGKMGISTLESYKGAQIFEAVGLNEDVVDKCFAGTASRIQGADFAIIADEASRRHELAYPTRALPIGSEQLNPGDYQFRSKGEMHMWDPYSIHNMQQAARKGDQAAYDRFAERQNQRSKNQATLRGLLKFKKGNSIPLSEVESVSEIVKRFATGAMSFGSISAEAHETLAIAMNRLGGKSNTGEGGEKPERFTPMENGDSKRSAIKQVASGRFGVTINYLSNSDEIQIKMAQGAKPGEGGELPGQKVFGEIAKTRYSTPGVGLISPPPHHDIYSIEDLAQLIFDLKNSNPSARISVKLVSEVGVGTIASGVAKGHADHILISGHDGGTGASAMTGIKNAGLPWELGVAETHQTLVMNDLRSRVVMQTDGQLKTGRDVVIATLLGAEEYGFATSALIAVGCIMMRKCQKNTCPVGVATQDPRLRAKYAGSPDHVVNYLTFVAEEARKIMAELGFRSINEMVGRVDMLDTDEAVLNWKAKGVDLSMLLAPAMKPHPEVGVYCQIAQDHGIDKVLDRRLIEKADAVLKSKAKAEFDEVIINTDRSAGTMLSHTLTKALGADVLEEDHLKINLTGHAGQSFGAWLAKGVTMDLVGDANDYVGKGLSGGKLIIKPDPKASFVPEENILLGNVAMYGATAGKGFFRGVAAERFCVRNSGAQVVVEGVGDHACEYMTGGVAVILGGTGRNFGAGMSGGIAYIYDVDGKFADLVNNEMVVLEDVVESEDVAQLKGLVEEHKANTGSTVAEKVLSNWDAEIKRFVKVISPEYKRVLNQLKEAANG